LRLLYVVSIDFWQYKVEVEVLTARKVASIRNGISVMNRVIIVKIFTITKKRTGKSV